METEASTSWLNKQYRVTFRSQDSVTMPYIKKVTIVNLFIFENTKNFKWFFLKAFFKKIGIAIIILLERQLYRKERYKEKDLPSVYSFPQRLQ